MTSDQQASMTKYSYLVFELEPVLAVRFKNLQSRRYLYATTSDHYLTMVDGTQERAIS